MIVAVIAAGAMGAGLSRRLTAHGVEVRTLLDGRSAASAARAEAAGMRATDLAGIAEANLVLSVVPPGEALALAERLAPVLHPGLVFADCNAVNPDTAARVEAAVAATGARFVDGGIIGLPPAPEGGKVPVIYASGSHAAALLPLAEHGLVVQVMDAPNGAASALKMSYAGITKGLTGLAAAMMLAATRAGAAEALHRELATSQPGLLAMFTKSVPGMLPKAYRWVAEMEEIAAFAEPGDPAAAAIYRGLAQFYAGITADAAGPQRDAAALGAFLQR